MAASVSELVASVLGKYNYSCTVDDWRKESGKKSNPSMFYSGVRCVDLVQEKLKASPKASLEEVSAYVKKKMKNRYNPYVVGAYFRHKNGSDNVKPKKKYGYKVYAEKEPVVDQKSPAVLSDTLANFADLVNRVGIDAVKDIANTFQGDLRPAGKHVEDMLATLDKLQIRPKVN